MAVYSEADRESLHVALADEAICIGGPRADDSYLNGERIVSAALATHAQAIHPGYGFLSENAGFAALCTRYLRVFIGPPAEVISNMGDKDAAPPPDEAEQRPPPPRAPTSCGTPRRPRRPLPTSAIPC